MGKDKATLPAPTHVDLLTHMVYQAELSGAAEVIISRMPAATPRHLHHHQIIADEQLDVGPLGGLSACLKVCQHSHALVLPVDMPALPPHFLTSLVHAAQQYPEQAVHLGEAVCSKRRELKFDDYMNIAHMLREAGKQVCLSTMTLLEAPSELRELRRYCDNGDFLVEANDVNAMSMLNENSLPFIAGSAISVYNHHTLRRLINLGMQRWVLPVELSGEWVGQLLAQNLVQEVRNCFETELFAFGHMPLAWSARCFTARSEHRQKDQCELCCIKYPDGRTVDSQDGQRVFVLNGVQTQSGDRYNLINQLPSMHDKVDVVRLSPQAEGTFEWLRKFQNNIHGQAPQTLGKHECNGYWLKLAGMVQQLEA